MNAKDLLLPAVLLALLANLVLELRHLTMEGDGGGISIVRIVFLGLALLFGVGVHLYGIGQVMKRSRGELLSSTMFWGFVSSGAIFSVLVADGFLGYRKVFWEPLTYKVGLALVVYSFPSALFAWSTRRRVEKRRRRSRSLAPAEGALDRSFDDL